mmetsp:Transcript_1185/g.3705  ORF Transcript_1185/g.3705 Transcript_1185/m.3705 type:complete len:291 (-) Transcript_1185:523-1395(-)
MDARTPTPASARAARRVGSGRFSRAGQLMSRGSGAGTTFHADPGAGSAPVMRKVPVAAEAAWVSEARSTMAWRAREAGAPSGVAVTPPSPRPVDPLSTRGMPSSPDPSPATAGKRSISALRWSRTRSACARAPSEAEVSSAVVAAPAPSPVARGPPSSPEAAARFASARARDPRACSYAPVSARMPVGRERGGWKWWRPDLGASQPTMPRLALPLASCSVAGAPAGGASAPSPSLLAFRSLPAGAGVPISWPSSASPALSSLLHVAHVRTPTHALLNMGTKRFLGVGRAV